MNILEASLFIGYIILLISYLKASNKNNSINNSLLVATVIVTMISLTLNGLKWTYYPLYLFVVVFVILLLKAKTIKKLIAACLFALIIISFAASYLFPTYQIPKPEGDYLIGTKCYDVVDDSRIEQYDDSEKPRKFRIQLYYPSDSVEGLEQASWLYDGQEVARGLSKDSNLPYFALDQMSTVKANCYLNATVSTKEKNYPLIIISHGWRGARNLHQDFAEELASRGYIVASIEHSYGSVITIFEDKKVASINYQALPSGSPDFLAKGTQLVNTYAADVAKSIDFISELNATEPLFADKIDLTKIGLIGHSTGGGAAVRLAISDARIKALIGLDAWVEPIKSDIINQGLAIPALFFRSEQWQIGPNNNNLQSLFTKSHYRPLIYQIAGTTHYDFAMAYMYSPALKMLGYSGDIDSHYLRQLLKASFNDFFDQTLKREEEASTTVYQQYNLQKVTFEQSK